MNPSFFAFLLGFDLADDVIAYTDNLAAHDIADDAADNSTDEG